MTTTPTPPLLWRPPADGASRLARFAAENGHDPHDYASLWHWSTTELDAFWRAVWRHFDVPADGSPDPALVLPAEGPAMPGATWFPDVRLNYAEAMLRLPGRADDDVVVVARSQSRPDVRLTAAELRDQVARAQAGLRRAGVGRGDRVAAYAPNVPETLVLLLAAASLGAVFSSCAPEFGVQSVVDRWQQIEPTLLLAVDGYRYGDKPVSRHDEVAQIRTALPSVRTFVHLPYLDPEGPVPDGAITWQALLEQPAEPSFTRVPFDAPLYVLYSSGTTGLPKPIVHGHGGITLEHLKSLGLHHDLGPDDTFFWFSTTGWMMWNLLVSGLLVGSTIVLWDGNPAHPDLGVLWRDAEELGITYFGTSAPFLLQCRKHGLVPSDVADLSRLRGVGSTGAPLPPEGFRWVHDAVGEHVHLQSVSGGTDVCAAFVGASPTVPVWEGEISCRCLGARVEAFDPSGSSVVGEVGELVITAPMPSMPVGFWGDDDGSRYRAAYFEDFPGAWRHGDWITISDRGTCTITGRSDATLNRGGVRLGTSEFYSVVEALPGVADSLVVHLEDAADDAEASGAGTLVLFVVAPDGLDDTLLGEIRRALRVRLSPRHVPDEIHAVPALPRTLSGKKLEVPVKRILQGTPVETAAAKGALADPGALDHFLPFRR